MSDAPQEPAESIDLRYLEQIIAEREEDKKGERPCS